MVEPRGLGWIKQKPSRKDFVFTARPEQVEVIPTSADLRLYESPVLDQGPLGSCTAHAGVSVYEFVHKKALGAYTPESRLFLYKESRDIEGIKGDEGSTLRATAKVMADEGLPPEALWPYDTSKVNEEPPPEVKAAAEKQQVLNYYGVYSMQDIKAALGVTCLPVMLGFYVYNGIYDVDSSGNIPIPPNINDILGGHAVVFDGYDDNHVNLDGSKGAFLIKNSWSTGWGDEGYGWLPYWYWENKCIDDCWVVAQVEMLDQPEPCPVPEMSCWERIKSWFS